MEVYITDSYSIFNKIIGNRSIDKKNLNRLKKSIHKIGLQQPILVNENLSIVDGQHRLQAVKELNIPVQYFISNKTSENDIDELQVSKPWNAFDYCDRNAKRGNEDCIKAIDIANEMNDESNNKFSVINAITLLSESMSTSIMQSLKNESYKINIERAKNIFKCLQILSTNNSTRFNPYSAVNSRVLKRVDKAVGGLNVKIIEKITNKNYLMCYNNQMEQYNYFYDLYKKYNK